MSIQKKNYATILLVLAGLLVNSGYAAAQTSPSSIAGITLGSNINSYPEITETNFLTEVVVTDWHGFRKGIISYGNCINKDMIIKIDMKYEDKSKGFYQRLLKEFTNRFGKPEVWSGDSFGVKYIWKWNFRDKENNRVSLKLQYNSKDSNETIGNMVKLAYPDKLNEERKCFMEMCRQANQEIAATRREELKKSGWPYLIPQ